MLIQSTKTNIEPSQKGLLQKYTESPAGSGAEVQLEHDLICAIHCLAQGETTDATKAASALEDRADRSGYHLYASMAEHIKQASKNIPSLRDLPSQIMAVDAANNE